MDITPSSGSGYFSVLRWLRDPTRGEARNVAIILLRAGLWEGRIKHAPLSSVSPILHEQGILDDLLVSLNARLTEDPDFTVETLQNLHDSLSSTLQVTAPQRTVLPGGDIDAALDGLYKAYVAPRGARAHQGMTKGRVLDRVTDQIRSCHAEVKRAAYVNDYLFDAEVTARHGKKYVLSVLSFASEAKSWIPVEHDAGYFLHAVKQVNREPIAVVQPPVLEHDENAQTSHSRVCTWLKRAGVPAVPPDDVVETLQIETQLKAPGMVRVGN